MIYTITDSLKIEVIKMKESGKSNSEIMQRFGITYAVLKKILCKES